MFANLKKHFLYETMGEKNRKASKESEMWRFYRFSRMSVEYDNNHLVCTEENYSGRGNSTRLFHDHDLISSDKRNKNRLMGEHIEQ